MSDEVIEVVLVSGDLGEVGGVSRQVSIQQVVKKLEGLLEILRSDGLNNGVAHVVEVATVLVVKSYALLDLSH